MITENRSGHSILIVAALAGGVSVTLGLVVLVGWYTHNTTLIQVLPAFVPMQYNTALGFLLCGLGLASAVFGRFRLATTCGGLAAVVGLLTLIQYISGVNLGIDQFLMKHYITVETSHPGRMAPNTAVCFTLTGISLVIMGASAGQRRSCSSLLGVLGFSVVVLGAVAFFGYLIGTSTTYGWGHLTRMAVHTAAGFAILGIGVLAYVWFLVVAGREHPKNRPLSDRRKIVSVAVMVMVAVTLAVSLFVIRQLHDEALEHERFSLTNLVNSWGSLVDAVARSQAIHYREEHPAGAKAPTLDQIADAHSSFKGFGETGEFTLAKRVDDQIVFLLGRRFAESSQGGSVPFNSELAEPMRRALLGESGVLRSLDYRGETVLAAYRPLEELPYGLVVKLDISEVSRPFRRAALLAIGTGFLIISLGTFFLIVTINPMVRRQELSLKRISKQNAVLEAVNDIFDGGLRSETIEDFGIVCLSVCEKLTGSKFGLFGELNAKGLFDTLAISNPGWDACTVPNSDAVVAITDMPVRGIDRSTLREGKSRIVNDLSSHPDKVGVPEGHPPVWSFLGVPLKERGRTVGMISLANKEGGYTVDDQENVEAVATAIVETLRRKRAEISLRHHTTELERSNKELQDFAFVASHDLQEPLRKVQAYASRLVSHLGDKIGNKGRDYCERMVRATERMQTLVNDLLNYSRVMSNAQPFVRVDLGQVVEEVLFDIESLVDKQHGQVTVGDLPAIYADPLQMRQLMQNLISNALKFHRSEEPPLIRITGKLSKDESSGMAPSRKQLCQVFVQDNGIGFDDKYLDRIFEVFQRLHGRDEYAGTGIGLAICRKIVIRHGGSITAISKPGQGATFVVTLPAARSQEEELSGATVQAKHHPVSG